MKKFCKAQIKVNYHETELFKECLKEYYAVFEGMLDTADYVPEKYNARICRYIFNRMKKAIRRMCKGNSEYQRELLKDEKAKWLAALEEANVAKELGQKAAETDK